jgi:chemotaxis methyl-accepting protein methylase
LNNDDIAFNNLKKRVFNDCSGFDLSQYSQDYVKRRLNARMMALGLPLNAWAEYLKILEGHRDEYKELFNAFSVNVTEFFRDNTLWETLKNKVFPELIAEKRLRKDHLLRIWSAGCSTCEEAYSISMILRETLPVNFQLNIFATDIDDDALAKARIGIYGSESVKNVDAIDPQWLKKYFIRIPSKNPGLPLISGDKYKLDPGVMQPVIIRKNNFLLDPPPTSQNDVIFCRNAMIYLTQEMKKKLIGIFYDLLAPHGMLVIGKSELICLDKNDAIFELVNAREHIYRKRKKPDSGN